MGHRLGARGKFIHKEIDVPRSRFIEILHLHANTFLMQNIGLDTSALKMKIIKFLPSVSIPVRKLLSARNRKYCLGSHGFKRMYYFT